MDKNAFLDIEFNIKETLLRGHSGDAIFITARIETLLEVVLLTRLPNLTKKLGDKLFKGYGPFASLSAKIDVLFAMGVVSGPLHQKLHVIKEIRNLYAHATNKLNFHSEDIIKLLKKFPNYDKEMDPFRFYLDVVQTCVDELNIAVPKVKSSQG